MSSSAKPAFPAAEPPTPAAGRALGRIGVLVLTYVAAAVLAPHILLAVLTPLPVDAILPQAQALVQGAVVARTPVLSTLSVEARP